MDFIYQVTILIFYWPFIIYVIAVLLLVAFMIGLSYFLGERHKTKATNEPYESGMVITGSARMHFPIHFYIIAMFFVVFDLEAVFIYTWGISMRETGWTGYITILLFIAELMILLFYLWRTGSLDFGPSGKKILKVFHEKIKQAHNEVVDQ